MPGGSPDLPLIGREHESRRLGELLDRLPDRGTAVVVTGEAGIGKSALLRGARSSASARGMRVLSTTGVESEAHLPFAGLQRLLQPVLGLIDRLPGPRQDALLIAFGMTAGTSPDPFFIGLAALDLVSESAREVPVLVLVDDAQWIDAPSAEILAFIGRRLDAEPVVLVTALRDGFASVLDDVGAAALRLRRLDDAASVSMLDRHAPQATPETRRRLLDEAAGNPLALVELPHTVEDGAVARPPVWLPLTTRLEHAFAARVAALPSVTRTLLLVAALNDEEELASALAATTALTGGPVTLEDLTPAMTAGLLEGDLRAVSFRHPLMRTAIRQRSSLAQRQAAHAAIGHALADDPARRVWHRAAACPGPDDDVAAELEAVAVDAQRRGAVGTAVTAWERAASLSREAAQRSRRFLRAAELAVQLGRHEDVAWLLDEAATGATAQERTTMTWVRDGLDDGLRSATGGIGDLADSAARVAADGDTPLALKLLESAALRCFWGSPTSGVRDRVVSVAESLGVDADDPGLLGVLALAAPLTRGALVHGRLTALAGTSLPSAMDARRLGNAASSIGALDLAADFLGASLADLRAQGRLGLLARALTVQSMVAAQRADLSLAAPVAEEAIRLARETAQPLAYATACASQALVSALQGEDAESWALAAERVARPVRAHLMLAFVQNARGAAALVDGDHAAAWEHLRRVQDADDPAYHQVLRTFALGDLAEAAVHSGHQVEARAIVTGMERLAQQTPSPVLHLGLGHARAVLASDEDADRLFLDALDGDLTRWPYVQARVQLAHGAWLRRQRRAADSRSPLRAAAATFDALGVTPWAGRARQELRASGERNRRTTPGGHELLTPQELQIAGLAAGGLSNREIGGQLNLSHRTVSSHLHRIFPKLGITSRGALRAALHRD